MVMNLPNLARFAELFGGQYIAALNASARKSVQTIQRANGQTVRGLPNLIVQSHRGDKFTLQGVVCTLNNWDDVEYSTAVKVGDTRVDGTIIREGDTTNVYGVEPFDWKSDAGTDSRCDTMRQFCREVCEWMDADSSVHFEEAPKQVQVRKRKAPSVDALNALGLA